MLKYFFAFIFSLGILLTPFYRPVIVYACTGTEMFPTYYGCPFIYKATNLGTSLAWDFFFLPTLANLILWMIVFLFIRYIIYKTVLKNENKITRYTYIALKFGITTFFLFLIGISLTYDGHSLIMTSVNFDNEAKNWGMTCEGQLSFTEYKSQN
jgi:hypothetical protein